MYQTLYRKWRPQTFDDVCGQEHVSSILRYEIMEGRTSHAYLFCGSRGTGKTTCAKLLARALNCENPQNGNPCGVCPTCRGILSGAITDVIEMDAASNNGVDNIRDIRDDVAYAPTECRKRVFIIDEVHMLSVSAFNALLKTLEEPPEHIVFILATTEMNKIPATILSRCQRFDFRRIETSVIASRLRVIADAEHIAIDDDALYLIAKLANGGMRDAIGMLELCGASGTEDASLSAAAVAALIGTSPIESTAAMVEAIQKKQYERIFTGIDLLYRDARDIGVFWQSLLSFYRDMLVVKTVRDPAPFLDLPEKQLQLPVRLAKGFTVETLLYHTRILDEILVLLQKNSVPQRVTVEMALIRMCDASLDDSQAALLSRMSALEDKVALGLRHAAAAPHEETPAAITEAPAEDMYPEYPDPDPIPDPVPLPEAPEAAPPADVPQKIPQQPARRAAVKQPEAAPKPAAAEPVPKERKVLRAFRFWQDAVRKVEASNPMIGSFLRTYKAYTCEQDGKFYLRAPDRFSVSLITSQKEFPAIRDAVNVLSGDKTYGEGDFVIECAAEKKTDGYELIDELIENAADNPSDGEQA